MDVRIRDEYIKLGQALKLAGFSDSGSGAKEEIGEGRVKVNGEEETRRGRKLRNGDIVEMEGKSFTIVSALSAQGDR
ncbi:MAG: RNA-binding S4 domain-containing protein [Lachnospiraceae bacterium]|jgi:ribosome-associated protein|nr:RNA-binding S4 domain-containing protein [Lachnospiraceae bacterium]